MSRTARIAPGGVVFHALNRAVARLPLFEKPGDYAAFERVMAEAVGRHPTRLLAWCLMPNHWHMVLWPRKDGELTALLRWMTHTHTMRWHAHFQTSGTGHVYQGRFKSFPVQRDEHFLRVARYVERNALRANLVRRAEDWRWCSLWHRRQVGEPGPRRGGRGIEPAPAPGLSPPSPLMPFLHAWPVDEPADWLERVNAPQTAAEEEALRRAVKRGSPYGAEVWRRETARRLGLTATLRPQGRPKKHPRPAEGKR